MRVACLQIENFRGVKTAKIRLGQHTVLIGPNNCGKTTIIESLALLFGRDRLIRPLTEHDFFGGDPQPRDRLRLIATITDFIPNDADLHSDWFREGRAVVKWYDEATGEVHSSRDRLDWKLACQIAYCARFDKASLDVDSHRYFHDDDAVIDPFDDESNITHFPSALVRDVGFFLVPASRTWDRIISFGSELFKRVISSTDGKPAESVLLERDRLRAPENPLESDPHLEKIVGNLNAELRGFFIDAPTLRLRVTTTDSEGVLEAVVPHYAKTGTLALRARRHGSGLLSLQGLLLLLQFGRKRADEGLNFLMALEEPELHVPPPLQRRLVHRLQALSSQTVISTHSPTVAGMCDPRTVLVLRNDDGELSATPIRNQPLLPETPNSIRSLFQLRRVETIAALMHDALLIPEGRIDHDWMQLLVRAVDAGQGWSSTNEASFGTHVGVISTQDAAVVRVFETLRPLHPTVAVLVDGDAAGISYAAAFVKLTEPPNVIMRWPDGWTLEDVLVWILSANEAAAVSAMAALSPSPTSLVEVLSRLRSDDRPAGGMKQDQIGYEVIAQAISSIDPCRLRACELLNAIGEAALGRSSDKFEPVASRDGVIHVFRP